MPEFESWLIQVRQQCVRIYPSNIVFVESIEALHRELPDADAVVVESLHIGETELDLARSLQVVQKFGFVTRNIDLSVGSIMGMVGMSMGLLQVDFLTPALGLGHPAIWVVTVIFGVPTLLARSKR